VTPSASPQQTAGQQRRIVDAILDQLPSGAIRRVEIVRLVADLGLGFAAARSLADRLVGHPDGLVSGHSDGPRAWLHLLRRLADRLPELVARPRCVRCRRTEVPLRRGTGGQRCCDACYARGHVAVCTLCGQARQINRRDPDGGAVCPRCDRRDPARWETCTACGKTTIVAARPETGPLCQNCLPRRLYTCARCGRPGLPAHAFTAAGPICGSCYHRGRVVTCGQCGTVSPWVRIRPDTGTALCDSCWQPTAVACAVCGIAQPIKRGRVRGTPLCEHCRAKRRTRRACVECGQPRVVNIRLLMGNVCNLCYARLRNHPAACGDCGHIRPLIGRNGSGLRICGPCAGEKISFICRTCGGFAALYADGNCPTCVARQRVTQLCSAATGKVHPQLQPVVDALDFGGRPRSIIGWIHDSGWSETLGAIARTEGRITHRTLDELPQTPSVAHLRAVLVHLGVLEPRDEEIDGTLPWLKDLLGAQPGAIAAVIQPYASWSVLRRARRRTSTGTGDARRNARARITAAVEFLTWVRGRGQTLDTVTQPDIDEWLTAGTTTRYLLRGFLVWARARRLCGNLEVPWRQRQPPESYLHDGRRRDLLDIALHDASHPLNIRVAAALVLLLGLTPATIVQIRAADVTHRDGRTRVRIGRHPLAVPGTLGHLVDELAARGSEPRHSIIVTRSDPNPWLFPGASPAGHASSGRLAVQLNNRLGLRVRDARNSALTTLALDMPAPVLADLLGISIGTAIRWSRLVNRDWTDYLADRTKQVTATPPCRGIAHGRIATRHHYSPSPTLRTAPGC